DQDRERGTQAPLLPSGGLHLFSALRGCGGQPGKGGALLPLRGGHRVYPHCAPSVLSPVYERCQPQRAGSGPLHGHRSAHQMRPALGVRRNHLQGYGHRDREGQAQRPDHPLLYRELPGGVRMKIAVGNSRMDKKWKNRDISWEDLCQRVSSTIRTTETVEEYRKLKKGAQDNIKDVGGFVGGQLREGRRKNGMVLCRSMLTLDMDYGEPGIWDEIDLLHDFRCCVYSTHKHTPEHPRLRMIIPLARDITDEEYPAVAR